MMKFTACRCKKGQAINLKAESAIFKLNLWGDQTISKIVVYDSNSKTYTLTISPASTLIGTAQPFVIVVPTSSYEFSAEVFDNSATPEFICRYEIKTSQTFTSNQVLNMPAMEVKVYPLTEGVLSGMFSVSATNKVRFSKGNLQYLGTGDNGTKPPPSGVLRTTSMTLWATALAMTGTLYAWLLLPSNFLLRQPFFFCVQPPLQRRDAQK